ncbi:MAG: FkbM family methyltransferase [archaeon]
MNNIIEWVSWIPYKLKTEILPKKVKKRIDLDLSFIGINKKFRFSALEKDEGLSRQLTTFGFREPINLRYSSIFTGKDDIVLDIGANLGLFSLLSFNAKKIISIEPIKECIPILKKNLMDNNLSGKSEVLNMAVGKRGKLILEKNNKVNLSMVVDKKGANTVEVISQPLEYFVGRFHANALRMDVEGYEYDILYKKIPREINKISMEFHTALLGNEKIAKLLDYFNKEGFSVQYLIEDLPIRLYPFYTILKKTGIIKRIAYVKKNLNPRDCINYINEGRKVKYLFLKRE